LPCAQNAQGGAAEVRRRRRREGKEEEQREHFTGQRAGCVFWVSSLYTGPGLAGNGWDSGVTITLAPLLMTFLASALSQKAMLFSGESF